MSQCCARGHRVIATLPACTSAVELGWPSILFRWAREPSSGCPSATVESDGADCHAEVCAANTNSVCLASRTTIAHACLLPPGPKFPAR